MIPPDELARETVDDLQKVREQFASLVEKVKG